MVHPAVISVPRNLDIFMSHEEVSRCLFQIPALVNVNTSIILDFEKVRFVSPVGALPLAAAIQAARGSGKCEVTGTYPSDRSVERILSEAGFFSLLGVSERMPPRKRAVGSWIRHLTGDTAQGEVVELLKDQVFGDSQTEGDAISDIYAGVTEAINNAVEHAYIEKGGYAISSDFVRSRWWVNGLIDRSRRSFTFVVCDLGIGIPRTVRAKMESSGLSHWATYVNDPSRKDSDLLLEALAMGGSRTELPWRGKGLRQVREVVDKLGGRLRIASNFAGCSYSRGSFSVQDFSTPVTGTVVEWTVPLDAVVPRQVSK